MFLQEMQWTQPYIWRRPTPPESLPELIGAEVLDVCAGVDLSMISALGAMLMIGSQQHARGQRDDKETVPNG